MKDSWFSDNNFIGLPDEVFNDVTNFFDFPLEDVETNVEEDWDVQFKRLEEPCFDVFHVTSSGLCGKTEHNPQLGRNFPTSCNGAPQIKQLAKTAGPTYGKTIPKSDVSFTGKHLHQFQTNSPVSVFENSSSSSAENSNCGLPTLCVKRTRNTSLAEERISSCYELKSRNKVEKQKEKDLSLLSDQVVVKRSVAKGPVATIKCMHCEVKKTPQWREGPMGPKTLCNACGVRYRSGRLYPEYRPAVSPTFVPSLHSNSHKKVIEMRSRDKQEAVYSV
ncbi:putative transcription factor C2C2-GATA family [Lupinus albus]|uniref:Putative transcription factor C2C2-GATA family n=1 Tax=Lupinus albus TaxID=3870 RepID=A0A6A4NK87_LUPAL|nr:putative transcription factor C2C2-GATA family [Lupinus albus]